MARTLQFAGELTWPLEDGKQAAKTNLSASLVYTAALLLEKQFSVAAVDEVIALPMASAKFVLLQATTADVNVKLNDSAEDIVIKAGTGWVMLYGSDGVVTSIKVSTTTVPATLKVYAFA